jgi:plastocyanin
MSVIRNLVIVAIATVAFSPSVWAGDVRGVVTGKTVPDAKKLVVVWVEGPAVGQTQSEKPVVSQSGVQFLPRVLTVVAGQTVSFPNEDDVAHNVFSLSQTKKFKLGIYPKGETREVTFEKPGVIDLFCSIHRHMHAVIVVVPNEFHTETQMGDNFALKGLPEGKHTLKVWNAAHQVMSKEIEVPATGEVVIDVALAE